MADRPAESGPLRPVSFTLNGAPCTVQVDPDEMLLDTLRERCGLRSAKRGCGQGQCGSCLVLVDGRAVTCCATPTSRMAGKTVVTGEGLPERQRTILARAFAVAGGVQCGFCTPGFVVRAFALLARNPSPTRSEIAAELRGHLCRCTGYVKILDAIELGARVLRGEAPLPGLPTDLRSGQRLPRLEAELSARGEKPFVSDLVRPAMLHGALRLGDEPRARVLRIDVSRAAALPGVAAVVTARDVPGERRCGLIFPDWPCFVAEGETTCMVGDVLAAVAAEDPWTARRAAALVEVELEPLAPLTDPRAALGEGAPRVHADRSNVLGTSRFERGEVDAAMAGCAHVVRERFRTQTVEHLYLEPEACLVEPRPDGTLAIYSQGQGIYDDRRQICRALALPEERVRVTLVDTGGAFGGKEDLSVQIHTALLARVTGRPVRLGLTREQSIRMHPKRHPFEIDYELGCDADGRLCAARVSLLADSGAYASVGTKVLERAVGHALGPYDIACARVEGTAVYTNHPPSGAMRGFGVGQVAFALEQLVDMLGERVGLDGFEMRELNLLRDGGRFGPGQRMSHCSGLRRTLQAVKQHYYGAKIAGIACGIKNVGLGNGKIDRGRVRLDVGAGGSLTIRHGMTEMGQGLHTVAALLLCEAVGSRPTGPLAVEVATDAGLDCGMTTASRATVLIGRAVLDAAGKLRVVLEAAGGDWSKLAGRSFDGEFVCDFTSALGAPIDEPLVHLTFGFATQVAILDEATGRVRKLVAAHDVGRALNPMLVEGQIEGSVHMGLGVALSEELPLEAGRPVDAVRKLGVLRAHETPEIEVILVEEPEPLGPLGARGVGEMGLVPTAPAVAAALYRFDGRRRTTLPMRDNYERR